MRDTDARPAKCPWCPFPPEEHEDIHPGHLHWVYTCPNAPWKWIGVFTERPVESPVESTQKPI